MDVIPKVGAVQPTEGSCVHDREPKKIIRTLPHYHSEERSDEESAPARAREDGREGRARPSAVPISRDNVHAHEVRLGISAPPQALKRIHSEPHWHDSSRALPVARSKATRNLLRARA